MIVRQERANQWRGGLPCCVETSRQREHDDDQASSSFNRDFICSEQDKGLFVFARDGPFVGHRP